MSTLRAQALTGASVSHLLLTCDLRSMRGPSSLSQFRSLFLGPVSYPGRVRVLLAVLFHVFLTSFMFFPKFFDIFKVRGFVYETWHFVFLLERAVRNKCHYLLFGD